MNHIGLFEGIGGFSLAARWMGWETIAWCEWNPFGQKILKHHFPKATGHGDITKTDFTIYRGKCDILTGGFPCQPYSNAGKRLGKEDDRHLWPEMLRAIREIQPAWVVGENVSGLISWNGGLVFDEVQTDLEAEGYEVWPVVLPACAVNAPHRRDRVWFIAYSTGRRINGINGNDTGKTGQNGSWNDELNGSGSGPTPNPASDRRQRNGQGIEIEKGLQPGPGSAGQLAGGFEGLRNAGDVANPPNIGLQPTGSTWKRGTGFENGNSGITSDANGAGWAKKCKPATITDKQERQYSKKDSFGEPGSWQNFPTQSPVRSRNDGVPGGLDGITVSKWRNESIKAYGNAIVPQVAFQIFKAIQSYHETNQVPQ
jgi:DNA (cytosine-5)-methyltransferase 1